MEQHYSNLVQKYLANLLTASEQEELAALSRLPENCAEWEEMMGAASLGLPEENDPACENPVKNEETPLQLHHEGPPAFKWQIEVQIDPALKRILELEEAALFEEKIEHEDDPASEKQLRQEGAVPQWPIEQPALKQLIEAEKDLLIERQSEHDDDQVTAAEDAPALNGQKTDEASPVLNDTGYVREEAPPARNWHNEFAIYKAHKETGTPDWHKETGTLNGHEETGTRNGHTTPEEPPTRNGHPPPEASELPPLKKLITEGPPPKRQRLDLERRIAAWKGKTAPRPPKRQRLDLESRIAAWKAKQTPQVVNKRKFILSMAAVAIVMTGLFISGYYIMLHRKAQQQKTEAQNRQLITPGTDKATLILSDGTAMTLDNAKDGPLTVQNGVEILKSYNELTYKVPVSGSKAVSNTLATPRGGEYQLILPDGSHVTLNAASSLTFPTVFNGVVREVTLYGEAFFEVAEDSARPFRVKAGETVVEVIGTSFNIMSYANEPVQNTTMVSGSVKLNALRLAHILRAGEQAVLNYYSSRIQVMGADVEEAVAWKNGKFRFVKRDIHTIMRQVERWYDVDVELKGDFSGVALSAEMSRRQPVAQLLEVLEASGEVHFETAGKRITAFSAD